ncbi:FAD-binding protein [Candidatus Odyssella thessalonicensis]|uniref:FAD-binding protein n=1 Tax=Candidatus Odyssella thessalonicensis TaxID=84647 RepID=UPI000225BFA9|nr:FAD-binding protein [Candidatus Odyssella thessalonicensis]
MKKVSALIFTCLLMNMVSPQAEAGEANLDVAIIGGGLSGLSAALNLKETTQNFMVFEA